VKRLYANLIPGVYSTRAEGRAECPRHSAQRSRSCVSVNNHSVGRITLWFHGKLVVGSSYRSLLAQHFHPCWTLSCKNSHSRFESFGTKHLSPVTIVLTRRGKFHVTQQILPHRSHRDCVKHEALDQPSILLTCTQLIQALSTARFFRGGRRTWPMFSASCPRPLV